VSASDAARLPARGTVVTVVDERVPSGVVVVLGRAALAVKTRSIVCCAVRLDGYGLPSEVPLPALPGVPAGAVAACDEPLALPVGTLGERLGALGPASLERVDGALRYALDVPGPIPGRLKTLRTVS
jgi:mRNA-degrading endonuclease toxin of MazEF toxin-antitoxin module